jgi:hypothetical protein
VPRLEQRGGVLAVENAVPIPTKNTASIELIGTTEGVTTANSEALELRVDGEPWHEPKIKLSTGGDCAVFALDYAGDGDGTGTGAVIAAYGKR